MARLEANQIKGLLPAIDRRKFAQPFVMDGRNFFVDVNGPRSGLSRQELAHFAVADSYAAQAFTTDADTVSWVFTTDSVLKFDVDTMQFIPVNVYTEDDSGYPWSSAQVGGKFYFAKRGVGLIEFDPNTGIWQTVDGSTYGADIPANIVSCCESAGRLVVAAQGVVAWSNIDDGSTMTTDTATGAGFQSLSLVASTTLDSVLRVVKTAEGFLVFTRNGTLRGVHTGSLIPFRVTALKFVNVPLNAWCVAQIDDNQIVFLSEQGFYVTNGGEVQVWDPLMSEYFRLTVIPGMRRYGNGVISLAYIRKREWMLVQISSTQTPFTYDSTFIWSAKSQEWGRFNRLHTGIFEFTLDSGLYEGSNIAFFDVYGSLFRFSFESADSVFPTLEQFSYWHQPYVEYPARYEEGVIAFPTVWMITAVHVEGITAPGVYDLASVLDESDDPEFDDLTGDAYETYWGFDAGLQVIGVAVTDNTAQALDSWVDIGPFRMVVNESVLEYSLVTEVALGLPAANSVEITFDDWLMDYSDDLLEDWLAESDSFEDWGAGATAESFYSAQIISSEDAENTIEGMTNDLEPIRRDTKTHLYTAYNNGVYHHLRISADDPYESYHIRSLELSGQPTGVAI